MHVPEFGQSFWAGKRVLVTGHTGFKGGWLTLWLNEMGAKVCGIGLLPNTKPSLFETAEVSNFCESNIVDVRDALSIEKIVSQFQPEIAFHLAAQPLVREGYEDPAGTFSTNLLGTVNFLEALRVGALKSMRSIVVVTTDKVYKNLEWCWPYREEDVLGGYDPYSASKAASEIIVDAYRNSFFNKEKIAISSARAGNVIGGGDWSQDRLIPDLIRAFKDHRPLEIRRPDAVRPWQHVLEPLFGYLVLAQKIYLEPSLSGAYNFGPNGAEVASVRNVVEIARDHFGQGDVNYAEIMTGPHEAGLLSLDASKSRKLLNFSSKWDLNLSIKKTVDWYLKLDAGNSALDLCIADIREYLREKNT